MGKLKKRDLLRMGITGGRTVGLILSHLQQVPQHKSKQEKLNLLAAIQADPAAYQTDKQLKPVADELLRLQRQQTKHGSKLREKAGNFAVFGEPHIEPQTYEQMKLAMRLPVAIGGALMPDAHLGYGLPIGGVLATENSVIPYGVGVDIGCRMCLSVFPLPKTELSEYREIFQQKLVANTRFGSSEVFEKPFDDPIFEHDAFRHIHVARRLRDKAYRQIGSSGGGNHFVEFGIITLTEEENEWNVTPGDYVALLSHSGSRGLGASIATHYTKKAKEVCGLPRNAESLAWLDLDTELGQEYWAAMNLAGDYASACHDHIHRRIASALGEKPLFRVENHHNFAWKEVWNGREVIVHRKGATPASAGVLGIIPGSMSDPGFLVRGLGKPEAIQSASHGAGRVLSRRAAKERISKKTLKEHLAASDVSVVGGGLDEAPMAYKDIREVMQHQTDLVETIGRFMPKIVRMAGD